MNAGLTAAPVAALYSPTVLLPSLATKKFWAAAGRGARAGRSRAAARRVTGRRWRQVVCMDGMV